MSNSRSKPTVERRNGAKSNALRMLCPPHVEQGREEKPSKRLNRPVRDPIKVVLRWHPLRAHQAPGRRKSGFRSADFKGASARLAPTRRSSSLARRISRKSTMLNRRTFVASAAAAGLVSGRGLAQPQAARRYGY